MKLIQYRFSNPETCSRRKIGNEIQRFFSAHNETRVEIVYCLNGDRVARRREVKISELAEIASASFEASVSEQVDYGKLVSITSLSSCRFVVFEDGGLVRICFANDDSTKLFDPRICSAEEVSKLLIETDLFDGL